MFFFSQLIDEQKKYKEKKLHSGILIFHKESEKN